MKLVCREIRNKMNCLINNFMIIVFPIKAFSFASVDLPQCLQSVVMESVLTTGTWSKGKNTFLMLFSVKRPISNDRENLYREHCAMLKINHEP